MVSSLELLKTGVFNQWFGPGLTLTEVLTVSKPSGNSISSVLGTTNINLVELLRLTLHGTFISFSVVVLGIVITSISSFSDDVQMRLTEV